MVTTDVGPEAGLTVALAAAQLIVYEFPDDGGPAASSATGGGAGGVQPTA